MARFDAVGMALHTNAHGLIGPIIGRVGRVKRRGAIPGPHPRTDGRVVSCCENG